MRTNWSVVRHYGKALLALSVVVGIMALNRGSGKATPVPPSAPTNIYDTALALLHDFVVAGDYRLGFTNAHDVLSAHLDTAEAFRQEYEIADSLETNGIGGSTLIDLHRKIYPVYARGRLCSAITFDSTSTGWRPVKFADGAAIRRYEEFKEHDPRAGGPAGERILVETSEGCSDYMIATAANGKRTVILPYHLHRLIREKLPAGSRDSLNLSEADFINARLRLLHEGPE